MKILHISTKDALGGAFRAAHRIHCAQLVSGMDSRMLVLKRGTDDVRVAKAERPARLFRKILGLRLAFDQRGWHTDDPVCHTFGQVSAGLVNKINAGDADIVNLHWISNMLSVADIGRLQKPIVWTLHDMWAFCGGEHYAPAGDDARFRRGYHSDNRPAGERGPDLNRKTWENKRRLWAGQSFTIVAPSRWLAECARQSILFNETPVQIIPNPLDTVRIWRPIDRDAARTELGLPKDRKLVLFGAVGGMADPRKGGDLLHEAMARVVAGVPGEIEVLIFGQSVINMDSGWPCPVHSLGDVRDDRVLAQAYSAADIMIVPSRQEAFGQTASEAQACGTPVAAFNIGGLPDIVVHRDTGWLASPFDVADLATGIIWLLADDARHAVISAKARERAVEHFSEAIVAKTYGAVYEQVLSGIQ